MLRLTRDEYLNSIEVTLGLRIDPDEFGLPNDVRLPGGFRNDVEGLLLTPSRVRAYEAIAEAVAERLDSERLLATHASCREDTAACRNGFVDSLGLLLLRRPLPEAERVLFTRLFDVARQEGQSFAAGAALVVRAMLQSPRFIYRLEDQSTGTTTSGGARAVDAYELATRLSFLIWNAAPDPELMNLAHGQKLKQALAPQVERLLAHDRARRALRQYVEQWLDLDAAAAGDALSLDMKEQTYRLFESIAFRGGDLMEVFTSRGGDLSPALARFYGLEPRGNELGAYDLSALSDRVGFLTHASVMRARTINPQSSLIDRGLFVLNDLLCESVPEPDGVELQQAIEQRKIPVSSGLSQRERFARQRMDPLCAGCHAVFDPLGEPFERFGPTGELMTRDEHGNQLTGAGTVTLEGRTIDYANVGEFVTALSASQDVVGCLVEKRIQYRLGRHLTAEDGDAIARVSEVWSRGGRSYQAILSAIASAPDFQMVEVSP